MSARLAARLRDAAANGYGDTIPAMGPGSDGLSLAQLLRLHGDSSSAVLLMLCAALTVLPVTGAGTVLSFAIWTLAWAWACGQHSVRLSSRLGCVTLRAPWSRRCLHGLAWVYEQAERRLRPRWTVWCHARTRGWWGLWIALMGAVIFLPLPAGNVLPGLSLILLSLGWMFRDGLALLLATVVGASAVAYAVSLGNLVLNLVGQGWANLVA